MHTTNYTDTFIEVAEDCPAKAAEVPPVKESQRTVANIHFDMIYDNPYKFTSDDIVFGAYAQKNGIKARDQKEERERFFSKGQPCLRASPLGKRYGWGVHSDGEGKVAIYPIESAEYKKFSKAKDVNHVKAMRSKRA